MHKTVKLLSLLSDYLPDKDKIDINNLLNTLENSYVAVGWPDCQDYMEEEWFRNEAILDTDSKIGDSTYLIPINRYLI